MAKLKFEITAMGAWMDRTSKNVLNSVAKTNQHVDSFRSEMSKCQEGVDAVRVQLEALRRKARHLKQIMFGTVALVLFLLLCWAVYVSKWGKRPMSMVWARGGR